MSGVCGPALPTKSSKLGVVKTQRVELEHVMPVAGTKPTLISVSVVENPVPSISTRVPPVFGPADGVTAETVGGAAMVLIRMNSKTQVHGFPPCVTKPLVLGENVAARNPPADFVLELQLAKPPFATAQGADQVRVPTLDMVSAPPVPVGRTPPSEQDWNPMPPFGPILLGGEPSELVAKPG
jgi:hypothetical protein